MCNKPYIHVIYNLVKEVLLLSPFERWKLCLQRRQAGIARRAFVLLRPVGGPCGET